MATIKGQNLRVMVDGKCIAMATSCTFHISAQVESASTKDDANDFQVNEVTGLSWDAQTDSLVTLTFDETAGTNNRTGQNSAIKRSGQAYLTDYSLSAQNRQNSTLSCQFTGTGPLS